MPAQISSADPEVTDDGGMLCDDIDILRDKAAAALQELKEAEAEIATLQDERKKLLKEMQASGPVERAVVNLTIASDNYNAKAYEADVARKAYLEALLEGDAVKINAAQVALRAAEADLALALKRVQLARAAYDKVVKDLKSNAQAEEVHKRLEEIDTKIAEAKRKYEDANRRFQELVPLILFGQGKPCGSDEPTTVDVPNGSDALGSGADAGGGELSGTVPAAAAI